MASEQTKSNSIKLFTSRSEQKTLAAAASQFFKSYGPACALLYAPGAAFIAMLKGENHFMAASGKEKAPRALTEDAWQVVFEARIFNQKAELRWLNEANGQGAAVILCADDSLDFFGSKPLPFKVQAEDEEKEPIGEIPQTYLLWGESTGATDVDGWTQFAEARIGAFFVPVTGITQANRRAHFKAVEYLGEYEDGNIAVCEERLIRIEAAVSATEAQENG